MCGIIGITNKTKAISQDLIFGLKALEYRGYDSAGIAFFENFEIYKTTKSIEALANMVHTSPHLIGIGHTRWATHGKICIDNAHPIRIKNHVIIHNGILENYSQLQTLSQHNPTTQTDTEILLAMFIHLNKTYSLKESLAELTKIAHGSFACAFLDANNAQIAWIKKGLSPLVCAQTQDGHMIASDTIAINQASKIFELPENAFGIITPEKMEIYPQAAKTYSLIIENTLQKNEYSTLFEKEMLEQIEIFAKNANITLQPIQYSEVLLIGCGSAYIACTLAKLWFEENGIKASAEIASEWNIRKSPPYNALAIFVSQSGETADTLAALRKAKMQGMEILAIVNKENSTIAKEAHHKIFLEIGTESSVASTKAFSAQLIKLFQLSMQSIPSELSKMAALVFDIPLQEIAKKLLAAKRILLIGRNTMYSVALEGALKIKELTYINIEAHAAGELKHGYLALIDEETITIALMPQDDFFHPKTQSNVNEIIARNGEIILISSHNSLNAQYFIKMPEIEYTLTPFLYTIILQRIAFTLAQIKNLPIDKPRNLAKSITVE